MKANILSLLLLSLLGCSEALASSWWVSCTNGKGHLLDTVKIDEAGAKTADDAIRILKKKFPEYKKYPCTTEAIK